MKAPFRAVALGPRDTGTVRRADGTLLLRSPHPLRPYPNKITERLVYLAEHAPDRTFVDQRDATGAWRKLSYAETLAAVRCIGQALLRRPLSTERTIAILSDNSIEHLLLALAAKHVGITYGPVSSAYSLVSDDFGKLRHVLGLLTPGLVFAQSGERFGRRCQEFEA